jgi:hypothetical protein
MLRTALQLAERGLAVFPCRPCDKRPATANGYKDATTDVITIQTQWQENPNYNIGVATGAVSGFFALDVDGAEAALSRLEAAHGSLPPTVEVITARGRHLYFKYSVPVGNTTGRIAEGIDTRGDGGYVIVPPSIHPSGKRYCWSVDSGSCFAQAPQWLLDKLIEKNNTATTPTAWSELIASPVAEGARNDTATRLAGHLLRRYVDPLVTYQLLLAWNLQQCQPPLPAQEIENVVASIAKKELQRRRTNETPG